MSEYKIRDNVLRLKTALNGRPFKNCQVVNRKIIIATENQIKSNSFQTIFIYRGEIVADELILPYKVSNTFQFLKLHYFFEYNKITIDILE